MGAHAVPGLSAQARALHTYLAGCAANGVTPLLAAMASEFSVSPRTVSYWLRDLEAVGLVGWEGYGRGRALLVSDAKTCSIRKDPKTGKPFRCKRCRCLNPRWDSVCAKCNQELRYDRTWKREAVRIAREMVREYGEVRMASLQKQLGRWLTIREKDRVEATTGERPAVVHVQTPGRWDKAQGANDQPAAGIVTTLLEAGLLGDEWRARQRAALGSESWMEDMT